MHLQWNFHSVKITAIKWQSEILFFSVEKLGIKLNLSTNMF